jgi:hypothetical protein
MTYPVHYTVFWWLHELHFLLLVVCESYLSLHVWLCMQSVCTDILAVTLKLQLIMGSFDHFQTEYNIKMKLNHEG